MKTSSDRQPLCCQNTFYKQFISVYKFTHKYLQDLKTHPGTKPQHRPPPLPQREGATDCANSDKKFQAIVSQEITTKHERSQGLYFSCRDNPFRSVQNENVFKRKVQTFPRTYYLFQSFQPKPGTYYLLFKYVLIHSQKSEFFSFFCCDNPFQTGIIHHQIVKNVQKRFCEENTTQKGMITNKR